MLKPLKLQLNDIRHHLRPVDIFVCSASYEKRCLSLPQKLGDYDFKRVLICLNENFPKVIKKQGKVLKKLFGGSTQVMLNTGDPLRTADSLQTAIADALKDAPNKRFLVDITTFTHEGLLVLLRLLRLFKIPSVDLAYATADKYSLGDIEESKKWLSKGIGEVRSVLGYPGRSIPSNKLHLIIMLGFEAERAEKLIQEYEPSCVSIGLGDEISSINPEHYKVNQTFHRKLVEKYANVRQFTFSPSDCVKARNALRDQVASVPNHNVLIAPMNTKISTVGAALLAMKDDSIQLCYAPAHQYNEHAYSSPGDECYYFSVKLGS